MSLHKPHDDDWCACPDCNAWERENELAYLQSLPMDDPEPEETEFRRLEPVRNYLVEEMTADERHDTYGSFYEN